MRPVTLRASALTAVLSFGAGALIGCSGGAPLEFTSQHESVATQNAVEDDPNQSSTTVAQTEALFDQETVRANRLPVSPSERLSSAQIVSIVKEAAETSQDETPVRSVLRHLMPSADVATLQSWEDVYDAIPANGRTPTHFAELVQAAKTVESGVSESVVGVRPVPSEIIDPIDRAVKTALRVCMNNIENTGTTAFKASRTRFADSFYKYYEIPGAHDASDQGTPIEVVVGTGVKVAGTESDFTQGELIDTGQPLDVAIEGDGFFQVTDSAEVRYTRHGAFSLNADGELVLATATKSWVIEPTITIPADATSSSISSDGIVEVQQPGLTSATRVGQIQTARFINPQGLRQRGDGLYGESSTSGVPQVGNPATEGRGRVVQGKLELSNVNLDRELATMQRLRRLSLTLRQATAIINTEPIEPTDRAVKLALGVCLNNIANAETKGFKRTPIEVAVWTGVRLAGTELDFTQGELIDTGQTLDVAIEGDGFFQVADSSETLYTRNGEFSIDSDGELLLATAGKNWVLEPTITIPSDATTISISSDGIVEVLQPGLTSATRVGQIQTARFANPQGLQQRGNNLCAETAASGTPQTGNPATEGRGRLRQARLEHSNVDLHQELATMGRLFRMSSARSEAKAGAFLDQNTVAAREIQLHDIVTVIFDEESRAQGADSESVPYRIAAVVTEKHPNGTVSIEARKTIRTNRDAWRYRLSGTVRAQDISKDNTVNSENITHLDIEKEQEQARVGGRTLPSPSYLRDDVQFHPTGPEVSLPDQKAALEEYKSLREGFLGDDR